MGLIIRNGLIEDNKALVFKAPDGIERTEISINDIEFDFLPFESLIHNSISKKDLFGMQLSDIISIPKFNHIVDKITIYADYLDKSPNASAYTDLKSFITINSYFYEKNAEYKYKKSSTQIDNSIERAKRENEKKFSIGKISHEFQHIIQHLGNLDSGNSLIKTNADYISKYHGVPDISQLITHHKKFLGEFEAYEIESRINLSQDEINKNPIKYPDDIILGTNNKKANSLDKTKHSKGGNIMHKEVQELKSKIERAQKNTMLTDAQKAQLVEKYSKQIDELSAKKEEETVAKPPKPKVKKAKAAQDTSKSTKIVARSVKKSHTEKAKIVKKVKQVVSPKSKKHVTRAEFKELMDRLIKKFPEYAEFKGYSKEKILLDVARRAKSKGKRTSKTGKTYYEYRTNRTDVKPKDKL